MEVLLLVSCPSKYNKLIHMASFMVRLWTRDPGLFLFKPAWSRSQECHLWIWRRRRQRETGRYLVVLAYYFFVFVYCLFISALFTVSNKFMFTSPSISFHRNESCRIVFFCYLRWECTAKRAWGLTFSLSIKMQIKKQNQVKWNWISSTPVW